MRPKRTLFVIGQQYVNRVRAKHPDDDDVAHLVASHESLRVLLVEAEDAVGDMKRRTETERLEAARTQREVARLRPAPWPDPTPCRGVYGPSAPCRCPSGRCWLREQADARKEGRPQMSYAEWWTR